MSGTGVEDELWRLNQQLLAQQEATREAEDAAFTEKLRVRELEHSLKMEVAARELAESQARDAKAIVEEALRKAKEDGASMFEGALATERKLREMAEASAVEVRSRAAEEVEHVRDEARRQVEVVRAHMEASMDEALDAQRNSNQSAERSAQELLQTLMVEREGRVHAEEKLATVQGLVAEVVEHAAEMERQSRHETELRVTEAIEKKMAALDVSEQHVQTQIEAAEKRAVAAETRLELEMEARKRVDEKSKQTTAALTNLVSALASATTELTKLRKEHEEVKTVTDALEERVAREQEREAALASKVEISGFGHIVQENPLQMDEEDLMDEFWNQVCGALLFLPGESFCCLHLACRCPAAALNLLDIHAARSRAVLLEIPGIRRRRHEQVQDRWLPDVACV